MKTARMRWKAVRASCHIMSSRAWLDSISIAESSAAVAVYGASQCDA